MPAGVAGQHPRQPIGADEAMTLALRAGNRDQSQYVLRSTPVLVPSRLGRFPLLLSIDRSASS
jgi:hypothetical protein